MSTSSFQQRGQRSGVFECGQCGRRTRHVEQGMNTLCPECDTWTAIENGMVDAPNMDAEEVAFMERQLRIWKHKALKKGGDAVRLGLTMPPPAEKVFQAAPEALT
jgi:hypothetical protein